MEKIEKINIDTKIQIKSLVEEQENENNILIKQIDASKLEKENKNDFNSVVSMNMNKSNLINSLESDLVSESKIHLDSKNILSLIEDSLKNTKIKDKLFIKDVLKKIINILNNNNKIFTCGEISDNKNNKQNLLNLIKSRLKSKKMVFLRHAQAEHNEYNIYHKHKGITKPKFYDPKITSEGVTQCRDIKEFIKNLDFQIQIVFSSPLRRTLQTLHLVKDSFPNTEGVDYIVTELLREEVTNPHTHFGHQLTQMKETFKEMDFLNYKYLLKEHWWSYEHDEHYKHVEEKDLLTPEKNNHFKGRLGLFVLWFIFSEENNACVISHSKVYKTLHSVDGENKSKGAKHGGCYILENNTLFEYVQRFIKKNFKESKNK